MATIDKININNTTYDISTTSVTPVTIGQGPDGHDVHVHIDENTKEIDILVVRTNLLPSENAIFTVNYLNGNTITEIFSLHVNAEYGIDFMGKLIKTSTGSLEGLFIAECRDIGQTVTSTRMTKAAEATNFSSKHTLVLDLINDNGDSSGTIDLLIVEKK